MLNNIFTRAALYAIEKPAPFLRYTAAGTYTLSTLAQAGGTYINKKIPQEQRNFIIFQELLNGGLQLITFLTLATGLENWGRKLADKGKILGAGMTKNSPPFIKGMAVLFSIIGTVLAFNVITPLIRNPLAAYLQKKYGNKLKPEEQDLTRPVIPSLKLNKSGNVYSNDPFAGFKVFIQTGKSSNQNQNQQKQLLNVTA